MKTLYGLVVSGGHSSRMGTDKSLLNYHGKPQRYYLYEWLSQVCDAAFISCNAVQAKAIVQGYQVITDAEKYRDSGPMTALLSAFEKYPAADFLIVGCDYPFVCKKDLEKLIQASEKEEFAVSYHHQVSGFREPLLAVYNCRCYPLLLKQYETGNYSLQHFLKSVHAGTIHPDSPEALTSIDTPEGYLKAIKILKGRN